MGTAWPLTLLAPRAVLPTVSHAKVLHSAQFVSRDTLPTVMEFACPVFPTAEGALEEPRRCVSAVDKASSSMNKVLVKPAVLSVNPVHLWVVRHASLGIR